MRFLDHTQRHITVGRTPLNEWSARRWNLYLTTRNTDSRHTSIRPVGFEPTTPAGERPQTYALDRVATGTGCRSGYFVKSSGCSSLTGSHWTTGQRTRVHFFCSPVACSCYPACFTANVFFLIDTCHAVPRFSAILTVSRSGSTIATYNKAGIWTVVSDEYLCEIMLKYILYSAVLFAIPPFSPQFPLHYLWLLLVSQTFVRQTWPCCHIECRSASSFWGF